MHTGIDREKKEKGVQEYTENINYKGYRIMKVVLVKLYTSGRGGLIGNQAKP